MSVRWVMVMSLLMSACSAATGVDSAANPSTLPLFDETATSTALDAGSSSTTSVGAESVDSTTTEVTQSQATSPTTDATASTTPSSAVSTSTPSTAGPSTTIATTTTAAPVDPNAAFCQAAIEIDELGTFTALDDTDAATVFFDSQAERWDAAASVAPASIAADTQTVATFNGEMRTLLAENDFNLFAVFEELTDLEASSGSDVARIRVDQFIFANCEVEPPLAEQSTAAFYGELLDTADDRTYLAELLASAEVFSLDGAQCFVGRATPDVMHPLVGAPSTPAQDAALASVLGTCQLSIGT